MRDIKFRIRLRYIKENGAHPVGYIETIYNDVFDLKVGVAFLPINSDEWEVLSYDQYTGLKDKNGTEIYEHDVDSHGRKVVWYNGCFHLVQSNNQTYDLLGICHLEIEITGNNYEQ